MVPSGTGDGKGGEPGKRNERGGYRVLGVDPGYIGKFGVVDEAIYLPRMV